MKALSFFIAVFISIFFIQSGLLAQNGWFQQNSGTTQTLNSISVINENTVFVCGANGVILKTTNGGTNWTQQVTNFVNNISDIFFIDGLTGFACGGYLNFPTIGIFNVLKTSNGGINWAVNATFGSISSPFISSLNSITFVDSQTGFIGVSNTDGFTGRGYLLKTTNTGVNWMQTEPLKINTAVYFPTVPNGYLLSRYWDDTGKDTAYVYKTNNFGSTWFMISKYSGYKYNQSSFINLNTGWIAGTRRSSGASFDGVVFKTVNGGLNWDYTTIISAYSVNSVSFPSIDTGYICGPGIYKTINGGAGWIQQLNPLTTGLFKIKMINSKTGWCVGSQGVILKTNTGGINAISKISEQVPESFYLFQNYPNPFNPITKFKFSIPKSNVSVKLIIYDILGNKIMELVNEKLGAGDYETDWDASNYSSGIYYYTLIAGDYLDTKKMIMIK